MPLYLCAGSAYAISTATVEMLQEVSGYPVLVSEKNNVTLTRATLNINIIDSGC